MVKFNIKLDISNRTFILIAVLFVIIIAGGFVVAYNSIPANPVYFGHSGDEINVTCKTVSKSGCSGENDCYVDCPSGYIVTGCAAGCNSVTDDYDLAFRTNGCQYGDLNCNGAREVYARCCKFGS